MEEATREGECFYHHLPNHKFVISHIRFDFFRLHGWGGFLKYVQ